MEPRIADFLYHVGSPRPPVSYLSRTPGYRIVGKGFGIKPGKVEIISGEDGATRSRHIKSWSDDLIEIDRPTPDPLGWGTWDNHVIVITADGRRSKRFEIVRPGNPYDGYIRPQDRASPNAARLARLSKPG